MSHEHIRELAALVGCYTTTEDGGSVGMYTAWWGPDDRPMHCTFNDTPQATDLAPYVLEYIKGIRDV